MALSHCLHLRPRDGALGATPWKTSWCFQTPGMKLDPPQATDPMVLRNPEVSALQRVGREGTKCDVLVDDG